MFLCRTNLNGVFISFEIPPSYIEDAKPKIGYDKPGIYEIISIGKCTARKMRNVRSIPQCEVPPGKGGCRKFEPSAPGEPVFEYNPAGRLWMRYLGLLGDPKAEAEAEAARIEGDNQVKEDHYE